MKKRNMNTRILLCLIVLTCLFTFIACALASGFEMGHGLTGKACCTDENCLICLAISIREKISQTFALLAICTFIAAVICAVKLPEIHAEQHTYSPVTPVCLKVKLSN